MWSIYGRGGVAVRTTADLLRQALPNDQSFQIAQIRYADRNPSSPNRFNPESSDDDPRIHRPHLVKGAEYIAENEVRVVTTSLSSEKGMLIRGIDANKLVQEVIISPLLPHDEAESLTEQIKKHGWDKAPDIRRSSLLGERAIDADRDRAAISYLLGKCKEGDLPPLIDDL